MGCTPLWILVTLCPASDQEPAGPFMLENPTVVFRGRQRRMALLEASGYRKIVCRTRI